MDYTPADDLLRAIENRDLDGINQARLKGASVNEITEETGRRPIWLYALMRHGRDTSYDSLWELVLSGAKNTASPYDGSPCIGLSPLMIGAGTIEAASSVALAVIKETQGNTQFNLREIFSYLSNIQDRRERRKEKILAIHQRVSERLKNPTTPFEEDAANSLTNDTKAYWLTPLAFPALADLPTATQYYQDATKMHGLAVDQMYDLATGEGDTVGLSTEEITDLFHTAQTIADSAKAEKEALRGMGLVGEVRPKTADL